VFRRIGGIAALALALCLFELAWVLIGLAHTWSHPAIGWIVPVVLPVLTVRQQFRVSRCEQLPPATRRFWRHVGVASVVLVFAMFSNAYDALGGPELDQQQGRLTLSLLVGLMAIVLYALMRLPAWQQTRGDWARFGLDTGVLVITCGGLLWHFSLRFAEVWRGQGLTMLAICVFTLAGVVVTAKVAFAGTGRLDRRAMQLLSASVAGSSAAGALAPLFVGRPYLSTPLLSVPIAAIFAILGAERQIRAAGEPPVEHKPRRRFSVLPYLAIAAMTATQLAGEAGVGGEPLIIAACVASLTMLVVIRQVSALRDNSRLLNTLDASLHQLNEYQEQLAHQVSHDALTGIANRSAFTEGLSARLAAGGTCHVALLDLDDFKVVNDRLGHGVGDALLRALSRSLHERLRPQDIVARLGGDEFTLLLPDLDDAEAGRLLGEVAEAVQRPLSLDGHDLAPRVSIGLTAARDGEDPEEVLRRADVAMYAAKNLGGGRIMWFDPIMDQIADADAKLAADLRQAIARA
jgi:diguanylate cyclase (GGDEF)-like protein